MVMYVGYVGEGAFQREGTKKTVFFSFVCLCVSLVAVCCVGKEEKTE